MAHRRGSRLQYIYSYSYGTARNDEALAMSTLNYATEACATQEWSERTVYEFNHCLQINWKDSEDLAFEQFNLTRED